MRARELSLLVVLVAVGGAGCEQDLGAPRDGAIDAAGAADGGTPRVGPPVEAEAFCDALAELVCTADRACCGTGLPPDAPPEAGCEAVQRAACEARVEPLLLDARVGYDPARAGAYLARLRAQASDCFAVSAAYADFAAIFTGTGSEGADCTPPGLGAAELRLAQLSCAGELACHLYLRSDGQPFAACEPREDDGCSHTLDCPAGAFCNLPDAWEPGRWGVCQPLRTNGWGCASDLECESQHCDPGGTCAAPPAQHHCALLRYGETVRADGALAHWRLGDAGGGVAVDALGEHDGVYVSGAIRSAGALAVDDDGAVQLDGVEAHARMPDVLAGADALTMECWFRRDDAGPTRPLLEHSDGERSGVQLWNHDAGSKVFVNFVDDGGGDHGVMSDPDLVSPGTWYHVAATYDGAVGRLYLNGEPVGRIEEAFAPRTGELYVGSRPTTTQRFLGAIDEVAVYPRALPRGRLALHHALGVEGPRYRPFVLLRWL